MPKSIRWLIAVVLVIAGAATATLWLRRDNTPSVDFTQLMTRGNALLEAGDAPAAIAAYLEALKASPQSIDVRLNLANAYLAAMQPADAATVCQHVVELDRNNAAAYYLLGCALLRQNQPQAASEAFQHSWKIEPGVAALDFQMGLAQQQLGHVADAISLFENVVRTVPDHPSAHFQLSQLYRRAGRGDDAARALAQHQAVMARLANPAVAAADLERCIYTEPLAPFVLAQPAERGIAVRFTEATSAAFGAAASDLRGPIAAIDYARDGLPGLFLRDQAGGFLLLENKGGVFSALGRPVRAPGAQEYGTILVGDLDNDGLDDAVVLGSADSRVFKFYEQGRIRDATRAVGLDGLRAKAGLLADLDFTGNLDLLVVPPEGAGLGVYRNLGNFYFDSAWTDSGLPQALAGASAVLTTDWNNEGLPGVLVARADQPPQFFAKKRAAAFAASDATQGWPAGVCLEVGDLDNDLRAEAVISTGSTLQIVDREQGPPLTLPLEGFAVAGLVLTDHDNDGWLDLIAWGGAGMRVWRNLGRLGFREITRELGLEGAGPVTGIVAVDVDSDGDTDLVTTSTTGVQLWRNDGGNEHRQLKLRLAGNRSNTSALGVRVEVVAGDWRTSRTVRALPMEIGVGRAAKLDALKVHWFDLATSQVDVAVTSEVHTVTEPTLPSGSCPYLYVWDGQRFRFVSDILGAAPLGLPMNERMFVFADPEELLDLGPSGAFPARDGAYEVRITEELREVLYLDEAHLIAVDHPQGTVIHPTSKMVPGPPFPRHELRTLEPSAPLRTATRNDGLDVTRALIAVDGEMASPVVLRRPQVRGLAEPYSLSFDFGTIPVDEPLVLALTGWIRFGGGMANISGSLDPTLPFPFPALEAELPDGSWQHVDVVVGTPAGKTKTILVDLEGKLPTGTRRLRLSTAFEIHWDCVQLCRTSNAHPAREHRLAADHAELRWRGYSRYANLPATQPLTPVYDNVSPVPPWDHTPGGWFTRYGAVGELVVRRDDRLALLAAGDELVLRFAASALPPIPLGMERRFFLHVVGWDKDADFHVEQGWRLEPLPFTGMNDQAYGREPRPPHLDNSWIQEFNTRWVSPIVPNPGSKLRNVP